MTDDMPRGRHKLVSDLELLKAGCDRRGPVFGAQEVSQHLEIGTEACRQRLNKLVEDDVIESKKIGGSNVYWSPCGCEEVIE